jgi:UDP-N-acetylglucosamine:LPS N-acetylglucosamine transferase
MKSKPVNKKLLAIASGGGHWVQLMRLRPAFEGLETVYLTVNRGYAKDVGDARLHVVTDASMWTKLKLVRSALQVFWIVLKERPDYVCSTGAAPGYFGLIAGKLVGARTVWIDSIANGEQLSLCGRKIGPFADLRLTQWPELARENGPKYMGSVL